MALSQISHHPFSPGSASLHVHTQCPAGRGCNLSLECQEGERALLPQLPSHPKAHTGPAHIERVQGLGVNDRLSAAPEDSSIIRAPGVAVPFDPASESLIIRPSPCFHKGENNCFQPRQRTLCTALGPAPQEPPRGGRTTPPRARRRGDETGQCRGEAVP